MKWGLNNFTRRGIHVRLIFIFIGLIASLTAPGCSYTARWQNLRVYAVDQNGQLYDKSLQQAADDAVREGAVSGLRLKRICVGDVGSWIGKNDLTIGITVTSEAGGSTVVGKGVLPVYAVGDTTCLQTRERQVIDPFVFKRDTYRIAFDIVDLPAKNARILSSLTSNAPLPVNLTAAAMNRPIAKVGSSLFDAFLKPAIDDKSPHLHFEQDFEAYEVGAMVKNPEQPWQRGTIVLLPREGVDYDVNGKKKRFHIAGSSLYLDPSADLRVGDFRNKLSDDRSFSGAPYAVLEITSSWRGSDDADEAVSRALRSAADAVAQTPRGPNTAVSALHDLRRILSEHSFHLTEWTISMISEGAEVLTSSHDALVSGNHDDARRLSALRRAMTGVDQFISSRGSTTINGWSLLESERDAFQAVRTALARREEPLVLTLKQTISQKTEQRAAFEALLKEAIRAQGNDKPNSNSYTKTKSKPGLDENTIKSLVNQIKSLSEEEGALQSALSAL